MPQDSIHRLNREWERIRLRYGIADSPPELDRLLLKSRRKRARLRDLRTRLAAIQSEVEVLEAEVAGTDKTLSLLPQRCDIQSQGRPWPRLVPDDWFRVWTLKDDAFRGYRVRWQHRAMTARCGLTNVNEDVPTRTAMRLPSCGVYAAKDADRLIEAHPGLEVMDRLRDFIFDQVYLRPEGEQQKQGAITVIKDLVRYYQKHPEEVPDSYNVPDAGPLTRAVDYVAGMTIASR